MDTILRSTYKIIEATDIAEYNALTDNQKELYRLFISAGKVSIAEDTTVYTTLQTFFGAESNTMAGIDALYPTPQTNIPEEE